MDKILCPFHPRREVAFFGAQLGEVVHPQEATSGVGVGNGGRGVEDREDRVGVLARRLQHAGACRPEIPTDAFVC